MGNEKTNLVSLIASVTYLSLTGNFKKDLPHSTTDDTTRAERNTGEPHPLSGSIPFSRRDSGSNPLTNHNAREKR
jgi:hypothetical protein